MKTAWTQLETRLRKQEMLNEALMKKAIAHKPERSLRKLMRGEIFGLVVILIFIPMMAFVFESPNLSKGIWMTTLKWIVYALLPLVVVWLSYKISLLMKIDLAGDVRTNLRAINRYNIAIHREKRVTFFGIIPGFFVLAVLEYSSLRLPLWTWAFMLSGFAFLLLLSIYSYKKIYERDIGRVRQSFEELEDLDSDR